VAVVFPTTRLFGRDEALSELTSSLEGSRLVTLWGPPGVGKTRLALALMERWSDFDAVGGTSVFADLTEAADAIDLALAIGRALSLEPEHEPSLEAIATALAERGPLLCVLDNFETVVKEGRPFVAALLERAPETRWLVTTREPVGLPSETLLPLQPLPLTTAAVELFSDRAKLARPDIDLSKSSAVVAELVKKLDGLPLAIELCAARAGILSPEQLLADLEHRFELLTPTPSAPGRKSALRDAIQSSWDALAEKERTLLAECSVFAGSFSAQAARAVSSLPPPAALDGLELLVGRALLRRHEQSDHREQRFSLLESIREFARERLRRSGSEAATLGRHARFYLESGRDWVERALSEEALEIQRRLELEQDNLLAVYERALQGNAPEQLPKRLALAAILCLGPLFHATGPYSLYLRMLDTARKAATDAPDPLSIRAEGGRGITLRLLGRLDEASEHLTRALRGAETLNRPLLVAFLQAQLARANVDRGDFEKARAELEQALEVFRAHGERLREGRTLRALGLTYFYADDLPNTRRCYQEALAIHREVDDRWYEGDTQTALALVELEQGELSAARERFQKALALIDEVGVRRWRCQPLGYAGLCEQEVGNFREAMRLYSAAMEEARELGQRPFEARFRGYQATCLLESGALNEAVEGFTRALDDLGARERDAMRALFRACLGVARASLGDIAGAKRDVETAQAEIRRMPEQTFFERAIRIHSGHLDLARARATQDPELGLKLRADARARLDDAGDAQSDIRFARRLLARALDETLTPSAPEPCLIEGSGAWFVAPHREKVELDRRKPLRRILVALAHAHADKRGLPVSPPDLIAAGWPGERIQKEAAANRLRVAMHTLRRLGLEGVLVTHPDGYLLNADISVQVADPAI
jgi:predicted ATPase